MISTIKAAGAYGLILQKTETDNIILFPSGNQYLVPFFLSTATLGCVGHKGYYLTSLGKAGKNRLKGKRPKVRGIAMNPVDHPNGGRANGGCQYKTPWGIPTKGKKTVYNKSNNLKTLKLYAKKKMENTSSKSNYSK